ncbi:BatA domain-containing protein [Xanthomonas arboricola pv. juglandis]|uniref:BatA domain-containing protein n=2 Tax=Xanthomonas arboricola TaxID=56448 RepID=UPI001AF51766|nr:BatA domain-containing protein [Xanthomonas arboricola]CAG2082321.1 BatA domain-containing protein [Xanthomonas arboricola pv. juglandis]
MNLLLLFPAGLAALAALLLPLLIHLARRSEHRPTDFAALRWLRAQPRPRHRLRFDEWPLLLVRLLLLAAVALLLAEPALRDHQQARPRVAVSPGVDLAAARALGHAANAQWVWLAPGFPPIAADATHPPATPAGTAPPVGSLLRELDASLPPETALRVIVPSQWGPLDAQRLQLSREVRWQVLPGQSPAAAVAPVPPLRLQAIADAPTEPALRYLRAVHAAWALPGALPVSAPSAAEPARWPAGTVVAWLSQRPPPAPVIAWVAAGGQLLLDAQTPAPPALAGPLQALLQDAHGAALIDAATVGRGRLLRWAAPLQPQRLPALLDADFPTRLHDALQSIPAPQRALAQTQQPQRGPAIRLANAPWPLAPWLIGLVLLLFAIERWLATAPRRSSAA